VVYFLKKRLCDNLSRVIELIARISWRSRTPNISSD